MIHSMRAEHGNVLLKPYYNHNDLFYPTHPNAPNSAPCTQSYTPVGNWAEGHKQRHESRLRPRGGCAKVCSTYIITHPYAMETPSRGSARCG
jgi:hypothetical protein